MNRERFWSDPAFAGSQKAARILGASASLSKVLRDGIGPGASAVGGRGLHTRMTKVIQNGLLKSRYMRPDGVIEATDWLQGFSGYWLKPLRGGLQVNDMGKHLVMADASAGGAHIWSFRGAQNPYLKDLPKWAGFVRLSVIGIVVSSVRPKRDGSGYVAIRPDIHGLRQVRRSPLLRISEVRDFSWKVNLDRLFEGIDLKHAGVMVTVGLECFDHDLQLATQEAAVPFGSLLPGWDSEGVPEGVQSRERFMLRKWKEAGLAFKALEVVYAGGVARASEERDAAVGADLIWDCDAAGLEAALVSCVGSRPGDAGTDAIRSKPVWEGAILGGILRIPEAGSS